MTPKDSDPFPFGKYKGVPYEDVPASYLLWLGDQPWISDWLSVRLYIESNRKILEEEVNERGS